MSQIIWSEWVKSTHSLATGNCLKWRWLKSSYSNPTGACVEARQRGTVQVRDSTLGDASPVTEYTRAAWKAFIAQIRKEHTR